MLAKVSTIDLRFNNFTGSVPTQLGKLSQMSSGFYFNSNSLSSAIPTGECTRAHELHELSAAAHHTHNRKRPITERPPARCARSPLTLTQPIHKHARLM